MMRLSANLLRFTSVQRLGKLKLASLWGRYFIVPCSNSQEVLITCVPGYVYVAQNSVSVNTYP